MKNLLIISLILVIVGGFLLSLQEKEVLFGGTKISELTELTSLTTDDLFAVVDSPASSPATKKVTYSVLSSSVSALASIPQLTRVIDYSGGVSTSTYTMALSGGLTTPSSTIPNATSTSFDVSLRAGLPSNTLIGGISPCLLNGTNCPPSSSSFTSNWTFYPSGTFGRTLTPSSTPMTVSSTGFIASDNVTSTNDTYVGDDLFVTDDVMISGSSSLREVTFTNATGVNSDLSGYSKFTSGTSTNFEATTFLKSNILFATAMNVVTSLLPTVTNVVQLGSATLAFADLFLGDGAVINFNNGNVTVTHSAGLLTLVGDWIVNGRTTSTAAYATTFTTQTLNATSTATLGSLTVTGNTTLGVLLGTVDAGGATSFEIPNGSSCSSATTGTICYDETIGQVIVMASGTYGPYVDNVEHSFPGFNISSSTLTAAANEVILGGWPNAFKITRINCEVSGGTSMDINIDLTAGGSNTNTVTCTTSNATTAITSNNNIAANTSIKVETSNTVGSVNRLIFRFFGVWARQ